MQLLPWLPGRPDRRWRRAGRVALQSLPVHHPESQPLDGRGLIQKEIQCARSSRLP